MIDAVAEATAGTRDERVLWFGLQGEQLSVLLHSLPTSMQDGARLVTNRRGADGFYVEDFGNGVVEATEIRKSGLQAIVVESGTADFSGSIGGGSRPCGGSFVCPGATYHAFGGIFAGTERLQAQAAEEPLQEIGGAIWRVGVNTGQEAQVTSFNSGVHAQSGAYRYRYEVTNSSLLPLPFTWSAIGFSGVVASGQTLVLERMSELAPQLAAAQTETVFDLGFGTGETDSIVMGLETLHRCQNQAPPCCCCRALVC